MTTVPTRFAAVILCFAGLFDQRTWRCAEQLLSGAILWCLGHAQWPACCGFRACRASG